MLNGGNGVQFILSFIFGLSLELLPIILIIYFLLKNKKKVDILTSQIKNLEEKVDILISEVRNVG